RRDRTCPRRHGVGGERARRWRGAHREAAAARSHGAGAAVASSAMTSPLAPIRTDWTLADVRALFAEPLLELVYRAATVHREHHRADEVQVCQLLSIKTGGCPEDCGYCSQSVHNQSGVKAEPLM